MFVICITSLCSSHVYSCHMLPYVFNSTNTTNKKPLRFYVVTQRGDSVMSMPAGDNCKPDRPHSELGDSSSELFRFESRRALKIMNR